MMASVPKPKACTKCKAMKSPADFSPDKRASDGLQSQCRACQVAANLARKQADLDGAKKARRDYYQRTKADFARRSKEFRGRHKEKIAQEKRIYYLKIRENQEWKSRKEKLRKAKTAAKATYDKVYRERNAESIKETKLRWRAENKLLVMSIRKAYKARRRSNCKGGDSARKVAEWEAKQEKVCYWCGVACLNKYEVDHYYPLARGGQHEVNNLVISCGPCNRKKNAKDPYEFALSIGRLF